MFRSLYFVPGREFNEGGVCLVSTQYKFVGKLSQALMSMSFLEIGLLGLLQGSM